MPKPPKAKSLMPKVPKAKGTRSGFSNLIALLTISRLVMANFHRLSDWQYMVAQDRKKSIPAKSPWARVVDSFYMGMGFSFNHWGAPLGLRLRSG